MTLAKWRDTFWLSDLRLVRATIGIGSLTWAWILLLGGPQWDRPAYFYLAQMAPQTWWGGAFLFVGVLQFSRALLGIPVTCGLYACTVAVVCAFLWLCVTLSLAISLTPMPAINAGNIVITFLACVVLVRAITHRG